MIYFNEYLVARTLSEIKDVHEFSDMIEDLDKINSAVANIQKFGDVKNARRLDKELREKYPCIDGMLAVAQAIIPKSTGQGQTSPYNLPEVESLKQDYYGIICGAAVKKSVVPEVKDMFERVD